MPDNVPITAGSGTIVAADEISSVYFQRVKQALGPDGTWVADQSGRAVGTDGVAYVEPRRKVVRVSDVISGIVAAAYAADDQVGSLQSVPNALRTGALSGTITNVVLVDADDAIPTVAGIDIYLWESDPALASDNAPGPGTSDADTLKLMAKIEMPAARDEVNNRTMCWAGAVDVVSSDTSLRYSLVVRGAYTAATTTGITTIFTIVQD